MEWEVALNHIEAEQHGEPDPRVVMDAMASRPSVEQHEFAPLEREPFWWAFAGIFGILATVLGIGAALYGCTG